MILCRCCSAFAILCIHFALGWQCPSRRQLLYGASTLATSSILFVPAASASAEENIVKVQVQGPNDSLGVQIINSNGQVVIQRVIVQKVPGLRTGMRLKGYSSPNELLTRISTGPYPIDLEFVGDGAAKSVTGSSPTSVDAPQAPILPPFEYTKRVLQPAPAECVIQSRKGDLLEIEYEAKYFTANGSRKTLYDASDFRGTGQPYQMVLGSGDMIPGVDLGLTGMCPGEIRRLEIPPALGYGPRARDNFKIPIDYRGLEWTVNLVSIDGSIRADNNSLTRQQREANYSE